MFLSASLKFLSATCLLVYFLSLKESTCKTKKKKLFQFRSPFRSKKNQILEFQMFKFHKHKTRNTIYWITWEVHTVCKWNLASLCYITKEKKYQKIVQKLGPESYSQALSCLRRIRHSLYWEIIFLKQAISIRYVIAKLSKSVKISLQISSDSFLKRIFWKLRKVWNFCDIT